MLSSSGEYIQCFFHHFNLSLNEPELQDFRNKQGNLWIVEKEILDCSLIKFDGKISGPFERGWATP